MNKPEKTEKDKTGRRATLEKQHQELLKNYNKGAIHFPQHIEWNNQGDFIVHFSLYNESAYSIASTHTQSL